MHSNIVDGYDFRSVIEVKTQDLIKIPSYRIRSCKARRIYMAPQNVPKAVLFDVGYF